MSLTQLLISMSLVRAIIIMKTRQTHRPVFLQFGRKIPSTKAEITYLLADSWVVMEECKSNYTAKKQFQLTSTLVKFNLNICIA